MFLGAPDFARSEKKHSHRFSIFCVFTQPVGSKADVTLLNFDVRFSPESEHSPTRSGCLLWAISKTHAPQHNQRAKYKRALSRRKSSGTSISVFVQPTAESGT